MSQRSFSRRTLLHAVGGAIAPAVLRAQPAREIEIQFDPAAISGVTPPDFLGLGYEISSVGTQGLLTAQNTALLPFIQTLGPKGNIRIGGNTSDFAMWSPNGTAVAAPKGTVTTTASLRDLGSWLNATGWDLIWGVNLGTGTADSAADQVAALAASAGSRLMCVEIGNEPDLFVAQGHRPDGYAYADFLGEFRRFRSAIVTRTPGVRFAGPDVAGATDWVTKFANDEGNGLRLLTQHYYAAGPPDSPNATIPNLLKTDDGFLRMTAQLQAASRASGVPYRLVEVNSCFGGGKPGMSDTFASALWGFDLMFTLASAGSAGINWQTGVNHLGFISSYSPIWDDQQGHFSARPLYYALLGFSMAGIGNRFPVSFDPGGVNLRAYGVAASNGNFWLTVINKDLAADVRIRVMSARPFTTAEAFALIAPSVDSKDKVMLAGSEVSTDGTWKPARPPRGTARRAELSWNVPHASAVLIRFSP